MALYLGNSQVKINLDGITCNLEIYIKTPTVDIIRLTSSDGFVLKDTNGLYLTPKESEYK